MWLRVTAVRAHQERVKIDYPITGAEPILTAITLDSIITAVSSSACFICWTRMQQILVPGSVGIPRILPACCYPHIDQWRSDYGQHRSRYVFQQ